MKTYDPTMSKLGQYGQQQYGQNTDISDDIMIPHAKVGTVIGFKGTNVNEIMRRSGCRVQVLQDNIPDGVDRKVLFAGTPQQIMVAKTLVAAVVADGPGALNANAADHSNRPLSPSSGAPPTGFVCGPGLFLFSKCFCRFRCDVPTGLW